MPLALAIPFGVLFAFAFLYATSYAYRSTFGAAFQKIIDGIHSLPRINLHFTSISFDFLATPFEAVDHAVRHAIGVAISATQHVWNYALGYVAHLITEAGEAIAGGAEDTLRAIQILGGHTIPHAITNRIAQLRVQVARLEHTLSRAPAVGWHAITKRLAALEHAIAVKAAAVAGTLPIPRIGRIEHDLTGVEKWIRSRGRLLTIAGISALLIAALGRLGLGWTRCSKVGRTGKQLCGMDESLLESLLADTLLIVGTVSLVEFAQGMQGVTAEVAPLIRTFWRAT